MKILFLSTHYPSAAVPQAGQPIALRKLDEYAQHHEVHLFVVSNTWEQQYANPDEFARLASVEINFLSSWQRLLNIVGSLGLPLRVANRYNRTLAERFRCKVAEIAPDMIHYEFTAAAAYYVQGYTSVVKEHDLTFISMGRRAKTERNILKRLFWKWDSERMRRWECAMLRRMDSVIVLSNKDLRTVESLVPGKKVVLEQPEGTAYVDASQIRSVFDVLYFGALNRFENRTGLLWFLERVWPLVLQESPGSCLHVVGGGAPSELLTKKSESVVFHGYVADPSLIFSRCAVAVAPILSGAGIKIKVLDYLASGLQVVATSVAAEGVESDQMVVADEEKDFALCIAKAQRRLS